MPVNTPICVRAWTVGVFDSIHLLIDWSKMVIPPSAPEWLTHSLTHATGVVLFLMTWVVFPSILRYLLVIHSSINIFIIFILNQIETILRSSNPPAQ
jgi:hypothetical protein